MHSDICTIFHKQFATFSKLPPLAGVSQICYSQADCTGDIVEAPGLTIKDCCVGTNNGQSFADNNGTCIEDQCVGKRIRMFSLSNVHSYILCYHCFIEAGPGMSCLVIVWDTCLLEQVVPQSP